MSARTIWKFPLALVDVQHITVPIGATFLTAQMQHEAFVLWALVDPDAPRESRAVAVIGTGNPIAPSALSGMRYLATVQDDPFVWHVFVPEDV